MCEHREPELNISVENATFYANATSDMRVLVENRGEADANVTVRMTICDENASVVVFDDVRRGEVPHKSSRTFSFISPPMTNSTHSPASLDRDPSAWWLWLEYWLPPIVGEFLSYLEAVKNRRLVFRDKLSGALHIVPYTTRFSKAYQRKVYGRFRGLRWDYGLLLTITTDLSQYRDIIGATRGLKKRGI